MEKAYLQKLKILIVYFPFFDFIYTKKTYRQEKKTNHTFHAYLYSMPSYEIPGAFCGLSPSVGQSVPLVCG